VHYGGVKGGNTNGRCLFGASHELFEAYNVEIGLLIFGAKVFNLKECIIIVLNRD
jgi:hypothetical protein